MVSSEEMESILKGFVSQNAAKNTKLAVPTFTAMYCCTKWV